MLASMPQNFSNEALIMATLSDTPGANKPAPIGTVILSQGNDSDKLIILQKGKVTLRSNSVPEDESETTEHTKQLFPISAPAILGGSGLIKNSTYSFTAVAETDCVVSVYPMTTESLLKTFQSKPNIAIVYLKSLLREVLTLRKKNESGLALLENFKNFEYASIFAYSRINPDSFSDKVEKEFNDSVVDFAKEVLERYSENGSELPKPLTTDFLESDHSASFDDSFLGDLKDIDDDLEIVERFTALPPQILTAIAQKDPGFFMVLCKKQAEFLELYNEEADVICQRTVSILNRMLNGTNSWLEKFTIQTELYEQRLLAADEKEFYAIIEYFQTKLSQFRTSIVNVWDIPLPEHDQQKIKKMQAFCDKNIQATPLSVDAENSSSVSLTQESFSDEAQDSMRKLVEFSEIEREKFVDLVGSMNNLKGLKTPFDPDDAARKTRRRATVIFWDIYERILLKIFEQNLTPTRLQKMFINFGFLDETFLTPDQVKFIYENAGRQSSKYPIYTPFEWFEGIYKKEILTSINELGVDFLGAIRQDPDYRGKKWKKYTDLPESVYNGNALIRWEVKNFMYPVSRVTYGSPMTYLGPLTKFHITQNLNNSLNTKRRMEEELDNILRLDFGAFHREILYSNNSMGINREFIKTQVIPNIILTPTAGTKMQFWQDREGNDRSSQGRIAGPHFVLGDYKSVLHKVIGINRWETVKTTMGVDWNNISVNSLTSEYTDYVQFFNKNRELSPELKEKIAIELKRFREDRERFAHDYSIWLKFESEGVQRMNKVVRRLFCKHVPFAKSVREHLVKLPAFADFIAKSNNIHRRKARELMPRYTKYERENGSIPEELKDTLKYYNLQY